MQKSEATMSKYIKYQRVIIEFFTEIIYIVHIIVDLFFLNCPKIDYMHSFFYTYIMILYI